jgi:hypothetical protein
MASKSKVLKTNGEQSCPLVKFVIKLWSPGQFSIRTQQVRAVRVRDVKSDRCVFFCMLIKPRYAWIILGLLHPVMCHNYYVECKTPLVLSGHSGFQFQTVPGSGQVKLKRNQDVLECGSELVSGESLGIDVRNTISGGLCND